MEYFLSAFPKILLFKFYFELFFLYWCTQPSSFYEIKWLRWCFFIGSRYRRFPWISSCNENERKHFNKNNYVWLHLISLLFFKSYHITSLQRWKIAKNKENGNSILHLFLFSLPQLLLTSISTVLYILELGLFMLHLVVSLRQPLLLLRLSCNLCQSIHL